MESIPFLGFATIIFFTKDMVKLPFFEFAWLGIPYQTVGVRSGKGAGITHLFPTSKPRGMMITRKCLVGDRYLQWREGLESWIEKSLFPPDLLAPKEAV